MNINLRSINFGRRYIQLKGPIKQRIDVRDIVVTLVLLGAIFIIAILALMAGTFQLSIQDIFAVFIGQETGMPRTVIIEWRLPRVIAAIIFGAGLAVSGAIFQSLTRNPLGSPDIIGFTAGSYTGALIALLIFGSTSYIGTAIGALIGGFATAMIIYLFAFRKGALGFRLIIVGIAISAILGSINSMLLLRSKAEVALTAAAWGVGSLNGMNWEQAIPAMIFVLILLVFAGILNRPLRQMELGEDTARSHGIQIERSQLLLILVAVGLTAAPTAVMGPISFIALVAPQIVLRFTKSAGSFIPVATMGALLLIGSDMIAQRIIPDIILPVGVVTLSVGGIYLVWLLFHQARSTS